MLELIKDTQIYEKVILDKVPRSEKFLWLSTADIKDFYVHKSNKMVPFLEILSDLVEQKVEIRLLHAKEPGSNFRKDFDKYPALIKGMERILCPRVHFKAVVIDGKFAYTGSANLTGAGMGAKSKDKRNFETGIITDRTELIEAIMDQFDGIWNGSKCGSCKRKKFCADFHDLLAK